MCILSLASLQICMVGAVPVLIVGVAKEGVVYFGKAYDLPDIVKLYKSANVDQNIPCGSRVMSIFTN